ncbi:hypothetical protein ABW636_00335 [Aquimarina sp. 2201CG1-2-11]|uniref:hypothetical protein n=1 Tax=Aquimarina discodermiae TaxID=3231043 RepID=UPI003461969C
MTEQKPPKVKAKVPKPVPRKKPAVPLQKPQPVSVKESGSNAPVSLVAPVSATTVAPIAKQSTVAALAKDPFVPAKDVLDAQFPTPAKNQFNLGDYPQFANAGAAKEEIITTPKSSSEDPNFIAMVGAVKATAKRQRKHEPATTASVNAQKAAPSPSNERMSTAQANQVAVMEEQEAGTFSAADFKKQLQSRIDAMTLPKNEEEADNFKENNNIDAVQSAAMGDVSTAQDNASGAIAGATNAAPNQAVVPVRTVAAMPTPMNGKKPATIPTAQAMPPKRSTVAVEQPIQEQTATLDTQMEQHGITDATLANSNEATFKTALEEKNAAKTQSTAATTQFRTTETQQLTNAQQQSQQQANAATNGMHASRVAGLDKVSGNQQQTATKDTAARKAVADKVQSLYEGTKTKVTTILDALDKSVAAKFVSGSKAAQKAFESHIETEMATYKKNRYGDSWFDLRQLRRVKDAVVGLPDEVNKFFESGRKLYISTMDGYLTAIANLVAKELNKAKQTIKDGKKEVQDYVSGLSPNLQKIGQQAASDIQSKFDSLEQDVDNKKEMLIDTLAQQYADNLASIDTQIEELKAANSGLVGKALSALQGVFDIIIKVKNILTNLLASVVAAVGAIITDPIGFLKNLMTGVGQGVKNFATNIATHLQSGLIGWLTGTLGSVSIQIPENVFSLKGIFSLTTQILGFTWDNIRSVGAKVIGEPIVKALETGFTMVKILRDEGIAGLWEHLKEQFQDLKETVIGAIKEMIMSQVVQAGIKWILGLLSPVGAFVKAVMAIVDVVKFFIERASQIAELVIAFTESIAAIAAGKVGAVAKSIENALGKAVPVVIGLLASVLGIGGLANKVLGLVRKVRKRVQKALTKLWLKIKKAGKKIWRKLGFGKKKKKEKKDEDLTRGDTEVGEVVKFKEGGENHRLWFDTSGKGVKLMVASVQMPVKEKLANWESRLGDLDDENKTKATGLIAKVRSEEQQLDQEGETVETLFKKAQKTNAKNDDTAAEKKDEALEKRQEALAKDLVALFSIFGDETEDVAGWLLTAGHVKEYKKPSLGITEKRVGKQIKGYKAASTSEQGIIVGQSENKFIKQRNEKNDHEIVFNKLIAISDVQQRRKRIGSITPHSSFYPILLEEKLLPNNGGKQIKYKYNDEVGNQVFTVDINPAGYPVKIVGDKLTLHDLGRGVTQDSEGKLINAGMDSAHLIANMFGGSGYIKAQNIVATSAVYNQIVMRNEEDKIYKYIDSFVGVDHFTLEVHLEFAEDSTKFEIAEVRKALAKHVKDPLDERHLMSDAELTAQIKERLEQTNQERVRKVLYLVKLNDSNGKRLDKNTFGIKESDLLFGTE